MTVDQAVSDRPVKADPAALADWANREVTPLLRKLRELVNELEAGGVPSGPAGGQLSGTYPDPVVVGLTESSGPDALDIGAIAPGEYVLRSGSDLIGGDPTAAVEADIAALQSDVSDLESDVAAVESDVSALESGRVEGRGNGAAGQVARWTSANAIDGDADLVFDPAGNGLKFNARVNGGGADVNSDATGWPALLLRIDNGLRWLMGAARANNDVVAGSLAGDVVFRTNSADVLFTFDNGGAVRHEMTAVGNVAFGLRGSYGGGTKVIFIANASAVPTTTPSGGGVLYVEAGALKYVGSSGTITTLGPA